MVVVVVAIAVVDNVVAVAVFVVTDHILFSLGQ